jgi:hypothetical protein
MLMQLVATWIPALLIGRSSALKLSGNRKILETMTRSASDGTSGYRA